MKKSDILILVLILTVLNIQCVNAQEKLYEGKALFTFNYPDAEKVNDIFLSRMPKKMIVYFKKGKTRVEYHEGDSNATLIDPNTKNQISLVGGVAKHAIKTPWNDIQKSLEQEFGDYNVKITNEVKSIAGFKCKKAIVDYETYQRGNRSMEVWFTDELSAFSPRIPFVEIEGFIMEYVYTSLLHPNEQVVDFRENMVCTGVEKLINNDDLFVIPDGYKIISLEEIRKNIEIDYH